MTSIIFGIIYFFLIFVCGCAISLILPRSKLLLGEIFPFGVGTVALIFFGLKLTMGRVDIWLFICALLLFIFSIVLYLRLNNMKLLVPITLQFMDFIILGILLIYAFQNRYGGFDAWA